MCQIPPHLLLRCNGFLDQHLFRACSRIPDDEEGGDEVDGGQEGFGQFVVASGDAAKLFKLVGEAFDGNGRLVGR